MKTFTIAGYSNLNGRVKLRVATGTIARRTAVLKSSGHTDINLVELPQPMTRDEARAFVEAQFADVELFRSKVSISNLKVEKSSARSVDADAILAAVDNTADSVAA